MGLRFCSLASGSSGNCQFIASEMASLLIDAGLSGKKIVQSMQAIGEDFKNIQGILVSHEHTDHIKGVGILSRRFDIPIYANMGTWHVIKEKIGKIAEHNVRVFQTGKKFYIKDMEIKPYKIPHDAVEPVAFSFSHDKTKISIATDLGYVDDTIRNEIKDADLLMIESNHDVEMLKMGKYPWYLKKRIMGKEGHLSNEAAGQIIAELMQERIPVENILLGHLSKENNFPELAYETIKGVLASHKIKIGRDIHVDLTYRDRVSKMYEIHK